MSRICETHPRLPVSGMVEVPLVVPFVSDSTVNCAPVGRVPHKPVLPGRTIKTSSLGKAVALNQAFGNSPAGKHAGTGLRKILRSKQLLGTAAIRIIMDNRH